MILCLIFLLTGHSDSDEQLMAGQFSTVLIEIFLEYEHSNPDPTFIVTLRIFYELAKNRNFLIAYFEKPGSNSSFQIVLDKA